MRTAIVMAALALGGSLGAAAESGRMHSVSISAAEAAALREFVGARYSRLKDTIEGQRKLAREFMSEAFLRSYLAEYAPDTEIPKFKRCAECPEFDVRITRLEHEDIDGRRGDGKPERVLTFVEMQTVPRAGTGEAPQLLARRLTWRACSRDYPCAGSRRAIEIMREDVLERRRALSIDPSRETNIAPTAPVPRAE